MRTISIAILLILGAGTALAGSRGGVTMPDRIQVGGRTLVLNGMGIREATFMKVDVYVAGLYLEAKSRDAKAILAKDRPWRVVMRFVRDVDREDLIDAWNDGLEKNGGDRKGALAGRVKTLGGYMRDVKKGQTATVTYVPGEGTTLAIDGQARPPIPGADFGRFLLSIWLGPEPPDEGLKRGMLGR